MCGRFTLRTPLTVLVEQFHFDIGNAQLSLRYNIAPTQDVAAVRMKDNKRQLALLRWGLIPAWSPEPKTKLSTFNARAEGVATSRVFGPAYKSRRCLIVADGYYEWLKVGKSRLPHLYEVDGGKPFAFAGLWESWRGELETCTVITTAANKLAVKIHDRMPVILDPVDYEAWLDPETKDVGYLLAQFPAERMTARRVSTYVNDARHEGPQCVAPPDEKELELCPL